MKGNKLELRAHYQEGIMFETYVGNDLQSLKRQVRDNLSDIHNFRYELSCNGCFFASCSYHSLFFKNGKMNKIIRQLS